MSKTNRGNFFEDFKVGQVIRHATPRTVTSGDQALYTALYGSRFAVQSSDAFAKSLGYSHAPVDDLLTFHIVFGKTVPDISLNAVANPSVSMLMPHRCVCTASLRLHPRFEQIERVGYDGSAAAGGQASGKPCVNRSWTVCRIVQAREHRLEQADSNAVQDKLSDYRCPEATIQTANAFGAHGLGKAMKSRFVWAGPCRCRQLAKELHPRFDGIGRVRQGDRNGSRSSGIDHFMRGAQRRSLPRHSHAKPRGSRHFQDNTISI